MKNKITTLRPKSKRDILNFTYKFEFKNGEGDALLWVEEEFIDEKIFLGFKEIFQILPVSTLPYLAEIANEIANNKKEIEEKD